MMKVSVQFDKVENVFIGQFFEKGFDESNEEIKIE